MSPPNIPYRLRLTQTRPYQGNPLVWDDNGVGGGDCRALQVIPEDAPGITAILEAFIGSPTQVKTVTLSAKVPE